MSRRWVELEAISGNNKEVRIGAAVREDGVADLQIILHELVDFHYRCLVAASVAVVGRREDRHDVPLVSPVIPIHDQLMRTCNPRQVIRVVELLRNILTETITSAAGADAPTTPVVRVGP